MYIHLFCKVFVKRLFGAQSVLRFSKSYFFNYLENRWTVNDSEDLRTKN
jgi:hypothetical protein